MNNKKHFWVMFLKFHMGRELFPNLWGNRKILMRVGNATDMALIGLDDTFPFTLTQNGLNRPKTNA